jgi:hypothetical protein
MHKLKHPFTFSFPVSLIEEAENESLKKGIRVPSPALFWHI